LYEVVAEDTSEEGTSLRRRGMERREGQGDKETRGQGEKVRQLEILPSTTIYGCVGMLPSELLMHRVSGEAIVPKRLKIDEQ
jgi:hypothetical protein